MSDTERTFEDAMQSLEALIERLESGDLSLEESLALYEEGQALAAYCEETLEAASLRLTELESGGDA